MSSVETFLSQSIYFYFKPQERTVSQLQLIPIPYFLFCMQNSIYFLVKASASHTVQMYTHTHTHTHTHTYYSPPIVALFLPFHSLQKPLYMTLTLQQLKIHPRFLSQPPPEDVTREWWGWSEALLSCKQLLTVDLWLCNLFFMDSPAANKQNQ